MSKRSKKGKFRPGGTASRVKFDVLPPQGDPEVSIVGYAALFIAALIGAVILTQISALAVFAGPLAALAIGLFVFAMAVRTIGRGK